MGLLVKAEDMPSYTSVQSGERGVGEMTVRKAYGREGSLMIAERKPGYHTRPHRHDCEQINYVLEGEIWFFVEDEAYHCRKGDFQRIPRNRIHWAWNKSDRPAVVIELHCPALLATQSGRKAASLLEAGEDPDIVSVDNIFVEYDVSVAEAKAQ